MQIHLVIGHNAPSASGANPAALYLGTCADEAGKSIVDHLATGQFPVVEQCLVPRGIMRYASAEAVEGFAKMPHKGTALEVALDANRDFAEEVCKLHETIAQLETDLLAAKFGRENMHRLCVEANKEVERLKLDLEASGVRASELCAELARITEERNRLAESSERVIAELQAEVAKLKALDAPATKAAEDNALDAVTSEPSKPVEKSGNGKGQKAQK